MRALLPAMIVCAALASVAPALAATSAAIAPSLSPDRLGARASLTFTIHYSGGEFGVPAPVRKSILRFPAGMTLDIPHLSSCTAARLRARGPGACPARTELGRGDALVEVHAGTENITEEAELWVFLGPPDNLQPTFEILAQGYTPIDERMVLLRHGARGRRALRRRARDVDPADPHVDVRARRLDRHVHADDRRGLPARYARRQHGARALRLPGRRIPVRRRIHLRRRLARRRAHHDPLPAMSGSSRSRALPTAAALGLLSLIALALALVLAPLSARRARIPALALREQLADDLAERDRPSASDEQTQLHPQRAGYGVGHGRGHDLRASDRRLQHRVTAEINIYPHGGSITGNGNAELSPGRTTASFSGSMSIERGTGSYAHAHGSGLSFSGTIAESTTTPSPCT